MTTTEVISNGKLLIIEICEIWDFDRDIHSYQAHVVDKEVMKRTIIGKFVTSEIAEQKAREWISDQ